MPHRFARLHPLTLLIFFFSVFAPAMFAFNPWLSLIFWSSSFILNVFWQKLAFLREFCRFYLPLMFLIVLLNPVFSHNGVTILFFLNGQQVTLEAILYGVNMAVMLTSVVMWFRAFNVVMTSDKLLFLLGHTAPKFSLVLCTSLRFLPLIKQQYQKIKVSQQMIGMLTSDSWWSRLKNKVHEYSILITYALENAVNVAQSMRARGFGQGRATVFSRYIFTGLDRFVISGLVFFNGVMWYLLSSGNFSFAFYPALSARELSAFAAFGYTFTAMVCVLPFVLDSLEALKWRYSKSKI